MAYVFLASGFENLIHLYLHIFYFLNRRIAIELLLKKIWKVTLLLSFSFQYFVIFIELFRVTRLKTCLFSLFIFVVF